MCMIMVPDQKPMERLFFGIDGFSHRWGIESEITFRRERVDPPPIDGSSENIILLDVIAENPIITAPFDLTFPFGGGWFAGSGTQLDMVGTTVQCELTLCEQIRSASDTGTQFIVTMELTDDDQTLRATAFTTF